MGKSQKNCKFDNTTVRPCNKQITCYEVRILSSDFKDSISNFNIRFCRNSFVDSILPHSRSSENLSNTAAEDEVNAKIEIG